MIIIVSPFFLVLPAFGFVLIIRPSATVSLFSESESILNPASLSFFTASSYVYPTTSGTVTSSTSWVDTNQITPAVISNSKKNEARATRRVFFFLGSSYSSSSMSSSTFSSNSSSTISVAN